MERICPIIKECPDKIACCYMDYTICSKRPDLTKEDVEFAYWDYDIEDGKVVVKHRRG